MKVVFLGEYPPWASYNHAQSLIRYAPPGVEAKWAFFDQPAQYLTWRFDDADAIVNLGSVGPDILRNLATANGFKGKILSRYVTMFPRNRWHLDLLVANSDAVLIESEACLQECRQAGYEGFRCVPTGVDVEVFKSLKPASLRFPTTLWLGGVVNQGPEREDVKGHKLAVGIMRAMAQGRVGAMILVACDPNNPQNRTPPQMEEWYNQGRVYLVTSQTEGVPNTALEAGACGCVVVSTPVGRMPELITDGVSGFLVQERTVDAFIPAIKQALVRATDMQRAMLERIKAFDWRLLAPRFYHEIEEVCNGYFSRGTDVAEAASVCDSGQVPAVGGDPGPAG